MTATTQTRMSGRDIASILAALSKQATPAPWSSFNGHVSAIGPEPSSDVQRDGRFDADAREFYGGLLICESCDHPDAVLIAAMRNLVPALIDAYFDALEDAESFGRQLRMAEAKATDAEHLVDLIRSQRYQPLQYPPAHVLGVRYHTPRDRDWEGSRERIL